MSVNYSKWPLLVDACMEWIAMRWTKSMIKAELKDHFKNDIHWSQVEAIIKAAKTEIKRIYCIDASEYRGRQISFYELIIREKKYYDEIIKLEARLKAAERLDKLFNLEGIQLEDVDAIAERVRDALQAMDEKTFKEVPDHARDKLKRLRETYNDSQREGSPTEETKPTDDANKEGDTSNGGSGNQEPVIPSSDQPTENKTVIPDTETCEDVASIDDLPEEIRALISNPKHDKAFESFSKRKERRKDLG